MRAFAAPFRIALQRAVPLAALFGVLAVGTGGCLFAEYTPGAIVAEHPPHATRQLGSLDVALDLGRDFERVGYDSLLLTIDVGNREARPCAFDLAAIDIAARVDTGAVVHLHLHDPRAELRVLHVDSSSSTRVRVRVDGPVSPSHVAAVCFDLRALTPDHPRASPDDVCFVRTRDGFMAVDAIGDAS